MRPAFVILVLLVAFVPAGARAVCAGPGLSAPASVEAGKEVTVQGEGFFDGDCDDTGGSCSADSNPTVPRRDIPLSLWQGEQQWQLTTVAAQPDGTFTTRVAIPDDVQPGAAQLAAPGVSLDIVVE